MLVGDRLFGGGSGQVRGSMGELGVLLGCNMVGHCEVRIARIQVM